MSSRVLAWTSRSRRRAPARGSGWRWSRPGPGGGWCWPAFPPTTRSRSRPRWRGARADDRDGTADEPRVPAGDQPGRTRRGGPRLAGEQAGGAGLGGRGVRGGGAAQRAQGSHRAVTAVPLRCAVRLGLVRTVRLAAVLDLCCVLAFVIIGRARHDAAGGESVGGIASTAWPFLAGLFLGWLGTRAWRRPSALAPSGVGAWLGAAGLGMVLRVAAGQGTAAPFVLVALAFLGLFLLGWRLAARLVSRFLLGTDGRGRRRFRLGRSRR